MSSVYLLWHTNAATEDVKLLGVFSSRESADDALAASNSLSGFIDQPEGYTVDKYDIDKLYWESGF